MSATPRIDLQALLDVLDPDHRGGHRHADEIAAAIHSLNPHISAVEVPDLVQDTILRGEREGLWSAARTVTARRGRETLPKRVTLKTPTRSTDKRLAITVPLRPELSWAATLRLSEYQRRLLLAVNDWLRRTDGGNVPMAATTERAYQLLGDEKAFDRVSPRGGTALWRSDRLTLELLRCERPSTPLAWEPVTASPEAPGPIVCVENHATFRTLIRVLRPHAHPPWAAVAWVQGRNTAPLESLTTLPYKVTRFDYLGDLDPAGLEIAVAACSVAETAGVQAGPAQRLWELLLAQPTRAGRHVRTADARRLTAWLPATVRVQAREILLADRAIPQEALRLDVLADVSLD
ncbi:hypothetical protein ABZ953_08250 [Streptomyces sp. NPDC046465]|uniref:hypothetical protein n=1 Tax=Streptomyces sp. NPDC046465 TaxID=3155810 RepID=UPI0033C86FB9